MTRPLFASSLVRFGLVAVVGLAIDLTTAWSLATFAGAPLPLAATIGFAVASAVNYVLHEYWTFGQGSVSGRRGSLYALTLLATLAARVGCVAALERTALPDPRDRLAVLILATGVSFVVNYLLSRHLVFRPASRKETVSQ